jgi:hypothetical protein
MTRALILPILLLCAGSAWAAPKKKAADKTEEKEEEPKAAPVVTTGAATTKLGLEYNLTLSRADHGLEKESADDKPKPTTDIALRSLKLKLTGAFNDKAEYKVSVDFANAAEPIEYAKATAWLAKSFGISAGKETVNQGGFEQKNSAYDTVILSPYNSALTPLAISAGVLELNLKVAGMITLQVVQDKPVPQRDTTGIVADDRPAQPAVTLEWLGDIKAIHPLVQLGSYDSGRSKFFDVGMGLTLSSFKLFGDVLYDMRGGKYPDLTSTKGEKKALDTTYRLIAFEAALELKKVHELFLRATSFEVDQPEDSTTGLENRGYNSAPDNLDDDALTVALGFRFGLVQRYFRPFVAVTDQMARFKQATDPSATETRSELALQVGVTGEM